MIREGRGGAADGEVEGRRNDEHTLALDDGKTNWSSMAPALSAAGPTVFALTLSD